MEARQRLGSPGYLVDNVAYLSNALSLHLGSRETRKLPCSSKKRLVVDYVDQGLPTAAMKSIGDLADMIPPYPTIDLRRKHPPSFYATGPPITCSSP